MSFDPPAVKGAISPWRSDTYQTFTEYAQDSIASWLLEKLKEKYPTHKTINGDATIYYSYFSDLNPDDEKVGLKLPAIAISVSVAERPTLGSAIGDGEGGVVAGRLSDCEITAAIIAQSAGLADSMTARLSRWLDRIVSFEKSPLTFLTSFYMADDRGFRANYSFDFPALFQTISEKNFLKMTFFRSGFTEDFIEATDNAWSGIVGGSSFTITSDDESITTSLVSHIALGVKFTPNIP